MARHRWDPVRDLFTLQDRMNRLFEDAAERRGRAGEEAEDEMERADWIPAADVYEDEGGFTVVLDLPGIRREGLDVSLEEGRLTIRGERAPAPEGARARRAERPVGRFVRNFTIPDTVDRQGIAADYQDGVLQLRLPRRAEQPPRRVKIDIK
jgi:HSP20 family protein